MGALHQDEVVYSFLQKFRDSLGNVFKVTIEVCACIPSCFFFLQTFVKEFLQKYSKCVFKRCNSKRFFYGDSDILSQILSDVLKKFWNHFTISFRNYCWNFSRGSFIHSGMLPAINLEISQKKISRNSPGSSSKDCLEYIRIHSGLSSGILSDFFQ